MEYILKYEDKSHKYWLEDDKGTFIIDLISATQLMSKHGLSVNYDDVPPEILENAALFGNIQHAWLERYYKGLAVYDELSSIAKEGVDILKAHGVDPIFNELKVNDEMVAGTIDMVGFVHDRYILIDYKFTYNYNASSIQWQLNIYKKLLKAKHNIEVSELKCLWYNKRMERFELRNVPIFDNDLVGELYETEKSGGIYIDTQTRSLDLFSKTTNLDKELFKLDKAKEMVKSLEEQVNIQKQEFYKMMEQSGIRTYYTDRYIITRVLPTSWTDENGEVKERVGYLNVKEKKGK